MNLPSYYGGGAASDPQKSRRERQSDVGRTAATNQYFLGFSSNYQSLQTQQTKRFSHDLAFTSAFTWGKALGYINDDGGLHFINWRSNYAPLDYDRQLNFEQSFTCGSVSYRVRPLSSSLNELFKKAHCATI